MSETSTNPLHDTPLYKAAIDSTVCEATGISTFEKMREAAYTIALPDWNKKIHEIETLIKKEFKLSKMPNSWRSAKSVCTTALRLNVDFSPDHGITFRGKTQLQKEIREARDKSRGFTKQDVIALIDKSRSIWHKLSSVQDKVVLTEYVKKTWDLPK